MRGCGKGQPFPHPLKQLFESGFVEDGNAQFLCPLQFRACVFAGEHVVCVLADRGGEGAPCCFETADVVVAGTIQRSCYDDTLARERTLRGATIFAPEVEAPLHKASYEIAVVFEVEVLHDGAGDDLSDTVDPCKPFDLDAAHKVLSTESRGDKTGRNRSYVPDTQGVEDEGK